MVSPKGLKPVLKTPLGRNGSVSLSLYIIKSEEDFSSQFADSNLKFCFTHLFCSKSTKSLQASDASDRLYKRISPLGDPKISIVPVLDQWVSEGRPVHKKELQNIIKELRSYSRFKHALEVSQWMTDKRHMSLTASDVAIRMNLIFKLDGLKAVENYFNCVTEKLKGFDAYVSPLNCYAHEKSVEKAEAILQKLRIMGCIRSPLAYNIMMNLYYSLGDWKKLDDLMHEIQEKGIAYDCITYSIRLSACAAASDVEGVDKIVNMMESDRHITIDCNSYSAIAQGYLKVGYLDKVSTILEKREGLVTITRTRNLSFDFLIKMYAEIGRKDDVYRIWTMYKKERKFWTKGYISMMSSLLKFNDVEGIEKIFEEWESSGLAYDVRVPSILITSYCRNGQLEKAEALKNKRSLEGGKPSSSTWYYMAQGYIKNNQISKAVEALEKAILTCQPNDWPSKEALTTSLEYLESREDAEKEEEFLRLLKKENIFSGVDGDRMLQIVKIK